MLIWAGDADSVCDWFGGFAAVNAVEYDGSEEFRNAGVENYTVGGKVGGIYPEIVYFRHYHTHPTFEVPCFYCF